MSSLDQFKIFRSKFSPKTPIEDVTSALNEFKLGVNRSFFLKLENKDKRRLHALLWSSLHLMWEIGPPQMKFAAVTTIGHVLVYLAPFSPDDFMITIINKIKKIEKPSILLLACYAYISKFFSPKQISEFSKDVDILKMVPLQNANLLPKIIQELLVLPKEMLFKLAEFFMDNIQNDTHDENRNKYFCKCVNIIISKNTQYYADLIKDNTSVEVIGNAFGKKLPKLSNELVNSLKNKSIAIITNFNQPHHLYSSACKVLAGLIENEQIPFDSVYGLFDIESIQNISYLEDLLCLPIEPEIICAIYGNHNYFVNFQINSEDFSSINQSDLSMIYFDNTMDSEMSINSGISSFKDISILPSLPLPDMPSPNQISPMNHNDISKRQNLTPSSLGDPQDSTNDQLPDYSGISNVSVDVPPPIIPSPLSIGNDNCSLNSPFQNLNSGFSDVKTHRPLTNIFPRRASINIPSPHDALQFPNPRINPKLRKKSFNAINFNSREITKMPPILTETNDENARFYSSNFNEFEKSPALTLEDYASYISSQSSIDIPKIDNRYIAPLMNYFQRFPQFQNELSHLIIYSIHSKNPSLINTALKIIVGSQSILQNEPFNCILFELFKMIQENKSQLALFSKSLDMIGKLCLDNLTKEVGNMIFDIIDYGSISKIDIIRKKVRQAFVRLQKQTSMDLFKFFFDMYIQKLDVFDPSIFAYRLSFISYVIAHIPGNWIISFASLSTFLKEVFSTFQFHRNIIIDILKIITAFASKVPDPVTFLDPFIKIAFLLFETNFKDYFGDALFHNSILLQTSNTQNSKNENNDEDINILQAYSKINTLMRIDTDIISHPKLSHKTVLKSAKIGFTFLSNVPWSLFNLSNDDKSKIIQVISFCAPIFPKETSDFLLLIHGLNILNNETFFRCLNKLAITSHSQEDLLAYIELYLTVSSNFPKIEKLDIFIDKLTNSLSYMSDLTYHQVISIKTFYQKIETAISIDHKIFEQIILPDHLNQLTNKLSTKNQIFHSSSSSYLNSYENCDNLNTLLSENDDDLSSLVISLTPLVFANIDIDSNLLTPEKVINFTSNSTACIDEMQCQELFDYALKGNSSRTIFYILKYASIHHYSIDIENNLTHPILQSKRMFAYAFSLITYGKKNFKELSPTSKQFIRHHFGNDLVSYVLNATPKNYKKSSILIQFDPNYFLHKFKKIGYNLTANQLEKLCMYSQIAKFESKEYFSFILHLFNHFSNDQTRIFHTSIIRRMITVFIRIYGKSNQIILDYLSKFISRNITLIRANISKMSTRIGNISPVSDTLNRKFNKNSNINSSKSISGSLVLKMSEHEKRYLTASEYAEISYQILNLSKFIDCQNIAEKLCDLLCKSSPYYLPLHDLFDNTITIDFLKDGQKQFLPSIQLQIYGSLTKFIKKNDGFKIPHNFVIEVLKYKILRTAKTDEQYYKLFSSLLYCTLSNESLKIIYSSIFQVLNFTVNSATAVRALTLIKSIETKLNKNDTEILEDMIQKFCLMFESEQLPNHLFVEQFASIIKSANKPVVFITKMINYLNSCMSYGMVSVGEATATHMMQMVSDTSEANNINIAINNFYVLFNAIVSMEKKNRLMTHNELQKKFSGSHLKALKLLNDPKYRIFSPLFALIDGPVPEKLQIFLDSIGEKIQRSHETDSYHEF